MFEEGTGLEYLFTLIFVLLICIVVKLRRKLELFKSVKEGLLVIGFLFVIGSIWDSFAILRGYWSFREESFIGINIGVMPLEEYLFMLVIPFLTLTVYRIVRRKNVG
jgi:lycopene cyclase domain-containing protein